MRPRADPRAELSQQVVPPLLDRPVRGSAAKGGFASEASTKAAIAGN